MRPVQYKNPVTLSQPRPEQPITTMESPSAVDDSVPIFYVGQHESERQLPISSQLLRQAQDFNVRVLRATKNLHD